VALRVGERKRERRKERKGEVRGRESDWGKERLSRTKALGFLTLTDQLASVEALSLGREIFSYLLEIRNHLFFTTLGSSTKAGR
jgi:hypothetical protein